MKNLDLDKFEEDKEIEDMHEERVSRHSDEDVWENNKILNIIIVF